MLYQKQSFVLDDRQDELENICSKFFHIKLLWKNFISATRTSASFTWT